ncbi:MAG: hypothetical protein K6A89_11175, partial [Treponema sp.]|nr:hypothetical protein [Treponema sp.]
MKKKKLFFEKQKSLKLSFFIIILALFAAVFSSCNNGLLPEENTDALQNELNSEDQKAYLVFNFSDRSGRAITSNFTPANFSNVAFDGSDGNGHTVHESAASFSELTGRTIYVDVGNWNFVLTADYGSEKYKATKSASITPGPNPVSMKLKADTSTSGGVSYEPADHPGSYELSVVFPADNIDLVHFEIQTFSGTVKYSVDKIKGTDYTGNGLETLYFSSSSFESGSFFVSVVFKHISGIDSDGNNIYEKINSWGEILPVNPGAQTTGTITLPKSEPVYSIEYVLNGAAWKDTYDGNITFSYIKTSGDIVSGVKEDYITLPPKEALFYDGYKFKGWFEEPDFSGPQVTQFEVSDLVPKKYYAKWEEFHGYDLTFTIVNGEGTEYPLTAAQSNTLGLQTVHDVDEDTELDAPSLTDGETNSIGFGGFYYDAAKTQPVTLSASHYVIPADQITANTTIYMTLSVNHVYVDPTVDDEGGLAFNVNTPAKTVEEAMGWLKGASGSNNVLYVKSAISNKTDIENLSGLSLTAASGGLYGAAIVKRHSSFTNGSLLSITENLTLQNVTLDGGAVWSKTQSEIEADPELLVTRTNSGLSSSIYLISTGAATFEGVTIQNVDNTATTSNGNGAAVYINSGTLTLTNCLIKNCRSVRGSLFTSIAGTINAVNTRFLCNNSIGSGSDKGHGGAVYLYGGATSGGQATFDACSFQYNAANAFGGAVYVGNNAKATFKNQGTNSLANNFSDMATAAASRTCKGDFIYTRGRLTLLGNFAFGTGASALSFYIDNASAQHPIILGDGFGGASTTGTAKIYLSDTLENSLNQSVLAVVFGDSSVNMANAKLKFDLAENDGNYLIDDNGYIKPIPGTVTVTPGFPGNYVCKWRQSLSGSTRTINIIVEDLTGNSITTTSTPVSIVSTSIDIGCYEGGEKIHSASSLSFNLPSWWPDTPSGTPFYVKFNVQVDATTAYSYDYWPEQGWIGSKAPDAAKEVGDIVFNDGSAMAYTDFAAITDTSVKNEKKAAAIALIFYKGNELNSGSDTTVRTLGVGLKHDRDGLAWCTNGAAANSTNITTIQCPAGGSAGALTFTGDKDGSNNLEQIEDFEGVNDTTTAANYPAFYFGKNYATNT